MIFVFYYIIAVAKFLVTQKNPFQKKRGMNFYYDIIDWLGGYPYEYTSIKEMEEFFSGKSFRLIKNWPAKVPTGCNEFIFRKNTAN